MCTGKREISALQVKCENADNECKWVGTVGTLQEHLDVCQYALILCPNRHKSSSKAACVVMRKDLDEHLKKVCPNRDHTCEYCGKKGTYAKITKNHDKVCWKKVIPCTNADCALKMERRALKRHLDTCEHTVVPCKYRKLGCLKNVKRKDISDHEIGDNDYHLHVALENVIESKEYNITFKLQLDKLESPPFYTKPNGYRLKIMLYNESSGESAEDSDDGGINKDAPMSFRIDVLEGEYDDKLKWPLVGKLSITLLNQMDDSDHLTRSIWIEEEHMERNYYSQWINVFPALNVLRDMDKSVNYYQNGTLYFRVSFESPNDKTWLQCTV